MARSLDLTAGFLAARHPAIARVPKPRWGARRLRRLIWCGIAGMMVWTAAIVATCVLLWLNALNIEAARLAEVERVRQLEHEAELMRLEITRIADLHTTTASQSLELASRIQGVLDTVPRDRRPFLARLIPEALRVQAAHRVPASAVLGMAAYESDFGRSELATKHGNYFGVKAFAGDWDGPRAQMPTRDNGVPTQAWFRSYASLRESVNDYIAFLHTRPRYRPAFDAANGPAFVAMVAAAGYCPDPDYAERVAGIIDRHHFDQLDHFGADAASTRALTASRQTPDRSPPVLANDPSPQIRPALH